MNSVAGYRLRATFSRRWGEYLVLALVIGLVGGVAMASMVAGRRTQSSYPDFLASTNASDLTLSTYGVGNASATIYSPRLAAAIARLPGVKRSRELGRGVRHTTERPTVPPTWPPPPT